MYERSESGANSRRNLWFGVFYLCKALMERERNEFLTLWIVQSNLLSLIVLLFSIWSFGLFLFGFLYRSGCLHPFKSLFLWNDVIGAEVWQGAVPLNMGRGRAHGRRCHITNKTKNKIRYLVKLILTCDWGIIMTVMNEKHKTLKWKYWFYF